MYATKLTNVLNYKISLIKQGEFVGGKMALRVFRIVIVSSYSLLKKYLPHLSWI